MFIFFICLLKMVSLYLKKNFYFKVSIKVHVKILFCSSEIDIPCHLHAVHVDYPMHMWAHGHALVSILATANDFRKKLICLLCR